MADGDFRPDKKPLPRMFVAARPEWRAPIWHGKREEDFDESRRKSMKDDAAETKNEFNSDVNRAASTKAWSINPAR
ncbi:hypothetical protein SNOG_04567 [Parastagonospora nodorum SN15]|uniref:Uncharacterized protein n=1 Tax=Phaeosphaeria nodorum (strain SN15 / ATCC MYA-4574 / FGSC 10173) TaxID=321614 RepID=Q0UUJ7_PHANO|nr:hypothetical protein SNOG_04567 [Parastagonospora nodorum SN15]EAT88327.1 hypothetical protein SNOG_04567 [Parastagonospora nodorum SN15]